MKRFHGHVLTWLVVLLLSASVLTACTVSVEGGLIGGGLSLLMALLLFIGVGVTQTGCDSEEATTDDLGTGDMAVGPCLSVDAFMPPDGDVGPCLGALPDDAGLDSGIDAGPPDFEVGPCLQPPLPDLGPCLSPDMNPDFEVGPCLDVPPDDAALPDAGFPDAELGPCLSPPPPPDEDEKHGMHTPHEVRDATSGGRQAVVERVLATRDLPPDIAARLKKDS
ncbi:MAG: hypothetical protein ACE366_24790 [Bradymonadia bacterium]